MGEEDAVVGRRLVIEMDMFGLVGCACEPS